MNSRTRMLGVLAIVVALALAGCGSSTPVISVALLPSSAQSLAGGQSVNASATVSNDKLSKGVTWSLSGTGTLSAQTATSVTYTAPSPIPASTTATITATSVADPSKTATLTINLQAISVALTPGAAQTLEPSQTAAITAAVSNDAASKGVTWSLSGAGALSGQTASAVTYTAPASIATASTATVTATSVSDGTKTAALTVNLTPPPSVTTSALPAGTVGASYTTSLAASNGVPPYAWSIASGALPGGLTLSGNTIAGTPTAYGTFNFTVQAKDADNATASANLSIKVNPAPVSIITTSLANGVVNASYSTTLQSTGGATPITWSVTAGSLPTGLVLNAATGAITGTPTTTGTSNFTVQAADSSAPQLTATKALSITIVPALSITTTSLPSGVTATAYNATLQSTGGVSPVTWSLTAGTLPAGLALNVTTGAISGTPTAAGASSFTVQAADAGTPQQKVTKALSIAIVQQLVITSTSLPTGAVTSLYSATLQSSGGVPAVTWSLSTGTLPAGLVLNANTGAITGTPTTAGTANFTVQATDSGTPQQVVTKPLSITVNPVLAVTTASPMPSGTVGTAYSQTLQANGGGIAPIAWSITAGTLPGGLSLNSSTGAITGTPNAAGTFNFTVQAADSGTPQQTASKALSISIATAPLSVATTGLPNGVAGQSYNGAVLQSAGGTPPVVWSISAGTLPAGLTLNSSTGAITGTPTTAGASTFTVKATDSTVPTPETATKQLTIQVNAVLAITTTTLPNGTVNSAYSATLQSSGGATPITWSISSGSLPSGLSLNASTGVIAGTPQSSGTTSFTVTATDATSPTPQTASQALSITTNVATLVVTTTNLQNGVVSSSYSQTLQFSGGTLPITWSITAGSLPAGLALNTSTGNISGTPTTAGSNSFTVKAADSTTPTAQTATANLTITVNSAACGTGSESLLNGQYAFLLKGFDSSTNPALVGGVITLDGAGHVSAGAVDMNLNSGTQLNLAVTGGSSSYSVGSDHRGCMTIVTSAGSQAYRFSLGNISSGVASTGHMIDFDTTGPFTTGVLRKQNSAAFSGAQISGSYAFGVSSAQNALKGGGKFGAIGVFDLDGSGHVTGGEVDFNQNGKLDGGTTGSSFPASPVAILNGGTYSVGSNGRGTLSFTPAGSSGAVGAALYVVSSSEVLIFGTDSQTTDSLFAGEMMQQSGKPFALSSVNGTYVGYDSGLGSTAGTSAVELLLINAQANGNFSVTIAQNNAGSVRTQPSTAGTYTVSATGRVTWTVPSGTSNPGLYLVSPTKGFLLNVNSRVDSGFMESQTGSPFSASSISGAYAFGTLSPESSNVGGNSGVASFDGVSAISGTSDDNQGGSLSPNGSISQTYSVSSVGLVSLPANCTIGTTCETLIYIISPTKAVVAEVKTTTTNPGIQTADK